LCVLYGGCVLLAIVLMAFGTAPSHLPALLLFPLALALLQIVGHPLRICAHLSCGGHAVLRPRQLLVRPALVGEALHGPAEIFYVLAYPSCELRQALLKTLEAFLNLSGPGVLAAP